jgi:tRNA(Ile)-lysidine synthase
MLRRYLEEIDEPWVEDPTNRELSRARNVVRHRLIPLIETELRRGATASLARTARNLAKVRDLLEEQAKDCLARCRLPAPPGEVRLDAVRLATYHEGLIEHALRQAIGAVRGSTSDIPAPLWRGIVALHARGGDGRFLIPNDTSVEVTGRTVRISRIRDEDPKPSPVHLEWRGRTAFSPGGEVRTRRLRARGRFSRLRVEGVTRMQVFDADDLNPPFRVRPPRDGDRVAIEGGGTKKVSDLLAERGVPRSVRDRQPVIEDASGILWVPGIRRADRALVDAHTDRLWVVRWIGRLPVEAALVGGETRR